MRILRHEAEKHSKHYFLLKAEAIPTPPLVNLCDAFSKFILIARLIALVDSFLCEMENLRGYTLLRLI